MCVDVCPAVDRERAAAGSADHHRAVPAHRSLVLEPPPVHGHRHVVAASAGAVAGRYTLVRLAAAQPGPVDGVEPAPDPVTLDVEVEVEVPVVVDAIE